MIWKTNNLVIKLRRSTNTGPKVQTQFWKKLDLSFSLSSSIKCKMLEGSRDALLKSTKETVGDPFSKEVEKLQSKSKP